MAGAVSRGWPLLLATVLMHVEDEDAVRARRSLEHLAMPERAHRIVVADTPMLLHAPAGELVVLRIAFVFLGPIDELNQVADLAFRQAAQRRHLRAVREFRRQL